MNQEDLQLLETLLEPIYGGVVQQDLLMSPEQKQTIERELRNLQGGVSAVVNLQSEKALRDLRRLIVSMLSGTTNVNLKSRWRGRGSVVQAPHRFEDALSDALEVTERLILELRPKKVYVHSNTARPRPQLFLTWADNVIPPQKVAPVQFDIVDGKLTIQPDPIKPAPGDEAIVANARRALIENGAELCADLLGSNADRRFVSLMRKLQEKLDGDTDIVALGIFAIRASEVTAALSDELSEYLLADVKAHLVALNHYLNQFDDWVRFKDTSARSELTAEDEKRLVASAAKIVDNMERSPVVDPQVPKTIRYLTALFSQPAATGKHTSFALLRTIENLVSKIYGYTAAALDEMIKATSKRTAAALSLALATIVLGEVASLSSMTAKIADAAWVNQATEVITKQIGKLTAD